MPALPFWIEGPHTQAIGLPTTRLFVAHILRFPPDPRARTARTSTDDGCSTPRATFRCMKRLAIALLLALSPALTLAKEVLPFMDNDYAMALKVARTKNVPLFVDAWAPW